MFTGIKTFLCFHIKKFDYPIRRLRRTFGKTRLGIEMKEAPIKSCAMTRVIFMMRSFCYGFQPHSYSSTPHDKIDKQAQPSNKPIHKSHISYLPFG